MHAIRIRTRNKNLESSLGKTKLNQSFCYDKKYLNQEKNFAIKMRLFLYFLSLKFRSQSHQETNNKFEKNSHDQTALTHKRILMTKKHQYRTII